MACVSHNCQTLREESGAETHTGAHTAGMFLGNLEIDINVNDLMVTEYL